MNAGWIPINLRNDHNADTTPTANNGMPEIEFRPKVPFEK